MIGFLTTSMKALRLSGPALSLTLISPAPLYHLLLPSTALSGLILFSLGPHSHLLLLPPSLPFSPPSQPARQNYSKTRLVMLLMQMLMMQMMLVMQMMMFLLVKFMWQDIEQEEEFLAQEMSHVSRKASVLLLLLRIMKHFNKTII